MRTLAVVAVVLAAAVRAACVSDPGGTGTAELCGAFTTALSVKDRMSQVADVFNPNEPIAFELLTTNTRNAPTTLTASSSCTAVVFEITDSAQRRYWGNADDIACLQMLQPRTYTPLEVAAESVTWDQRGSNGAPVPPGTYTVSAAVGAYVSDADGLVDCRVPLGKSATFTIR